MSGYQWALYKCPNGVEPSVGHLLATAEEHGSEDLNVHEHMGFLNEGEQLVIRFEEMPSVPMNARQLFDNVDWHSLRLQKLALLNEISEKETTNPEQADLFQGILHFIDAIQDLAVDRYGVDPGSVYLMEEVEGES